MASIKKSNARKFIAEGDIFSCGYGSIPDHHIAVQIPNETGQMMVVKFTMKEVNLINRQYEMAKELIQDLDDDD